MVSGKLMVEIRKVFDGKVITEESRLADVALEHRIECEKKFRDINPSSMETQSIFSNPQLDGYELMMITGIRGKNNGFRELSRLNDNRYFVNGSAVIEIFEIYHVKKQLPIEVRTFKKRGIRGLLRLAGYPDIYH